MITIAWHDNRCVDPQGCYKCLGACPEGVFMTYPREKRGPGKAAENWAITASFLKLCTGCRICEQICPENAIIVSVTEKSAT